MDIKPDYRLDQKPEIVTKEFLDEVLTADVIKRYVTHLKNPTFKKEHIEWAYDNLIDLNWRQVGNKNKIKYNEYMQRKDLKNRNKFVRIIHCIEYELDHGYRIGDEVEYYEGKGTKHAVIMGLYERNMMKIDDKYMPVSLIKVDDPEEPKQMEFF